ncbi:hypothetical protein [Spirosoma endophyticum]|uniref:Uncharacterized protein n=1 Tax=Spirosoma endophyticum TaxID=662367 RepID=A0A1I2EV80_9BACT|nr:hypothetical protein [Spirosoma endophyticum]SFE96120.1 hypothetical protein SAMN05216167_12340 [Spirosoma endophyticum]
MAHQRLSNRLCGLLVYVGSCLSLSNCVDPADLMLRGRLDVVVIDGTITSLAEPQVIQLNRSIADPLTGLPGWLPQRAIQKTII